MHGQQNIKLYGKEIVLRPRSTRISRNTVWVPLG